MIHTLAIANYRSLLNLIVPLGQLNLITGANASGKSNLYKALRLLSETAQGGVIHSIANEGGLDSTFWAGPEKFSKQMRNGEDPVQGGPRQKSVRLSLGFSAETFSYAISLGLPIPGSLGPTAFSLDPEIKRECIWAGDYYRQASSLVDRSAALIKVRRNRRWEVVSKHVSKYESIFTQVLDPLKTPEIVSLREQIRRWRFYDHFRVDAQAPCRLPQLGTRTPVLHSDGHDLAAALQTIIEIGDLQALDETIADAFPGSRLAVQVQEDGRFIVKLHQHGLLRPLSAGELSDGTLRYLLWVAALLTPRPPSLMVLNEPETSLHPQLLPALARLIIKAAKTTQVWVVSHCAALIKALEQSNQCNSLQLDKNLGQTQICEQGILDQPPWVWPDKDS